MRKMRYISIAAIIFCYLISAFIMYLQTAGSFEKEKENNYLLSEHIFDSVHESIYRPILISRVMTSDSFLQEFLVNEEEFSEEEAALHISKYLHQIREEFGYSAAFVISEKTHRYYTASGIAKIIDPQTSPYDIWYKLFLDSKKIYDLDTDRDQANDYKWTVFVNIRVTTPDGQLLGVCGVGVNMSDLQLLFENFESEYNLKINLIDPEGLVQVDTQTLDIENAYIAEAIIDDADADNFSYKSRGLTGFRMTRYMRDLEWYLVIQGVNNRSKKTIYSFFLLGLFCIITLVIYSIIEAICVKKFLVNNNQNNHEDPVTKLPSRNYLRDVFGENGVFNTTRFKSIVVFDVDNFTVQKEIGDEKRVLAALGKYIAEAFEWKGIVVRWSDDDFVALLEMTPEEAENKFIEFCSLIRDELNVTLSVGISEITDSLTIVVSEETGSVSYAKEGRIVRDVKEDELIEELKKIQSPEDSLEAVGDTLEMEGKL